MSKSIDSAAFRSEIATKFPDAELNTDPIDFGDVHLRFELGDDHPNGSDERIAQATERAVALFREVFSDEDYLILLIKDWDSSGRELWPSKPPGCLFSLIRGFDKMQPSVEVIQKGEDYSYRQLLVPASVRELDYYNMLRGITHREQGRLPRINASVYFVSTDRGVVFYMYDDRGCLIYSDIPDKLRGLYRRRRDWLVAAYRSRFDTMFRER